MPEHNCGGWCSGEKVRTSIEAARQGKSVRAVAEAFGVPMSTIGERLAKARKLGCIPSATMQRGPSLQRISYVCGWCKEPFTAKRSNSTYCCDEHARLARRAGVRVNQKHGRELLGPEQPEVRVDEVGLRRRLKDAAESGVDTRGLQERFGGWVSDAAIDAAISRARVEGKRDDANVLPLGMPA